MSARAAWSRAPWVGFLALAVFSTLALPVPAQEGGALGFPPTLDLTDPGLLRGQTQHATLHYQVLFEEPVEATFDVVPRTPRAGDAWTDASAWVRIAPQGPITIAPTEDYPVQVSVAVPSTAANGEYRAGVRIRVAPSEGPEGSGAGVEQSGTTILVLRVTGDEVKRVASGGTPVVRDVEAGGVWTLTVPLANTGNVRANPHVRVDVWDQMRTRVVGTLWENTTFLDPGEARDETLVFHDVGLPLGQYWAVVEVFMDGVSVSVHQPVTFDVVEEGSLKRLLELRSIRVAKGAAWVEVGELVLVEALVRNVGALPVDGVLQAKVEREGKLLDALDSEPLEVPVGADRAIALVYKVERAGQYAFTGHVRYGSKVTDERTTLLNVQGGEEGLGAAWLFGGAALVVIVASGGIVMARRRRRAGSATGRRPGRDAKRRGGRPGKGAPPRGPDRSAPAAGQVSRRPAGKRGATKPGASRPPRVGQRPAASRPSDGPRRERKA